MFGLGKVQLGVMVALAAATLVLGTLYVNSLKALGAAEAINTANELRYESAIREANEAITELRVKRAEDQARILALSKENSAIRAEADADRRRLDKHRSTLAARTLEKPEVTRRTARRALRRQGCEIWEITGGKGECPK